MKYLALIQARCDSSRLKNKVLLPLGDKPVLQCIIERVRLSRLVDEVMVITSIGRSNLPILSLCANIGVRVYVGSEDDVLDRYYQASRLIQPEYIIRITGDCPLFDAGLLDQAIEQMAPDTDFLSMLSESFADGLDLEIMRYDVLQKAWKEARLSSQREHVTQYIIQNPDLFMFQDFVSPIGYFGNKRWTLDEQEDYDLILAIYEHFNQAGMYDFTYRNIISFLDKNPELEKLNAKYTRNEGLAKSLAADHVVESKE